MASPCCDFCRLVANLCNNWHRLGRYGIGDVYSLVELKNKCYTATLSYTSIRNFGSHFRMPRSDPGSAVSSRRASPLFSFLFFHLCLSQLFQIEIEAFSVDFITHHHFLILSFYTADYTRLWNASNSV
jgi:hypothetical protein